MSGTEVDQEWGDTPDNISTGDSNFPVEPQENIEPVIEETQEPADQQEAVDSTEVKPPKKKGQLPTKTRVNQLTREKYQAENEARLLREEVERLKQLNESSNMAAMSHYDNSVNLAMQQAMQRKAEAIQNGDVEAQVKADVELARVAAQQEQLAAFKAEEKRRQARQQQEAQKQQYQPEQQYQQPQINEDTENWLAENEWFVPQSPQFDPDMYEEVTAFANALDARLRRQGRADEILTKDYFDEINSYVAREFYNQQPTPSSANRNLNMKQAPGRAPVAPVGRSGVPANQPQKVVLTAADKEMARASKISEEKWLEHKIKDMKLQQLKGVGRNG